MSKKIKKVLGLFLVILFLFISKEISSQIISPYFFGQNAWMPDTIGNAAACPNPPCVVYGKLHKQWANIKGSGAAIVRFGGIKADKNMPTNFQYIKMIDSIKAKGMEPIMQVPFHMNQYTAQQAAAIVQYINITKGKKIKYWIIGNEPDLGYSYTTSAQVAAYFKPFASAMKAVDPTILTIGPECAWYDTGIINGLTTPNGPDDITGKDANGRYYCDIISFHTYPFNGTQTRSQVISKLMSQGSLNSNLIALNSRINNCNTVHNRTGSAALRTAITEANVDYQNPSTDNLNDVGACSFIGGQFVAELLSIGMKNNVNFINIWSVIEGNTTALNIGYIDAPTGKKKPLYYHYKLLADNFKGNYLNGTSNQPNVKTFGSQNAGNTNVLIMNQDLANNYNFTVRLNTGTVTGIKPLKINIAANINVEYNDAIQNQTTILLTFNQQGVLIKKCTYSLANEATNNLPPTCENFSAPMPIGLIYFKGTVLNDDKISLEWETATETNNDFFTVQRSRDGINFDDVTSVKGAGTSQQYNSYKTFDNEPYNGVTYYRLKQTDYDGSYTYSQLQTVMLNKKENDILIFPNPGDGSLINIKLKNVPENSDVITRLYDMQGRLIEHTSRTVSSDVEYHMELVPQSILAKGMYIVYVSLNNVIHNNKILVR